MFRKKLMMVSMIYLSSLGLALAGDECEFYQFSVHNKNLHKKVFVKYGETKKTVEVKPDTTQMIDTLDVGTTDIKITDSKQRTLFKGQITKNRSTFGGDVPGGMYRHPIYLAGLISLTPLSGVAEVESNDSGDCVHNKMGEYTIAVD